MDVFVERLVYLVLFFIILLVPLGILLLANFGERRPTARILTIIAVLGMGALLALLGLLSLVAPFAASMAEPSATTPMTSFFIAFLTGLVLLATAVGVAGCSDDPVISPFHAFRPRFVTTAGPMKSACSELFGTGTLSVVSVSGPMLAIGYSSPIRISVKGTETNDWSLASLRSSAGKFA